MIPISPPLRGGVAARSKNSAKPPYSAQTGWWTNHQNIFREIKHHPVCGAKERGLFMDAAATPPRRGGEKTLTHVSFKPGPQVQCPGAGEI